MQKRLLVLLSVETGEIKALVQGSSLYKITIHTQQTDPKKWETITKLCSGEMNSVIELLQGKLSTSIMKVMTKKKNGLFPEPFEITFECSCPDGANMCKHVAAVLYGIGSRLDHQPELLFKLRNVNHLDLITPLQVPLRRQKALDEKNLSLLFGIDIEKKKSPSKRPKKLLRRTKTPPK